MLAGRHRGGRQGTARHGLYGRAKIRGREGAVWKRERKLVLYEIMWRKDRSKRWNCMEDEEVELYGRWRKSRSCMGEEG